MRLSTLVAAVASGITITAGAQSTEYRSEMAELKAQNAAMRELLGENWLTTERAEEIKALVRDVLADAETRASLQGFGATAGYDGGFFVSSSDGSWSLKVNGLEQVRFVYNSNDNGVGSGIDTFGFENRRTQLTLSGTVVDPTWTWMVRMNYSPAYLSLFGLQTISIPPDPYDPTGGLNFQDMWITKSVGSGFSISAGQFKTPFMRESLLNDGAQLTVERSVVDYYFSSGYQQGLMLSYTANQFRFSASYGNGFRAAYNPNTNNFLGAFYQITDFQNNGWDAGNQSIALAARLEVMLSGDWKQFDKETSFRGEGSGLLLGGAVGYENPRGFNSGQYVGLGTDLLTGFTLTGTPLKWTVDATAMFGGGNLSAAFVGQNGDNVAAVSNAGVFTHAPDQDYYGAVAQGGYLLTEALEVFGRWEWMSFNNDPLGAGVVQNILTFGVNNYFAKNDCKWTLDVGIPLNDNQAFNSFGGANGAGWDDGAGDQWNIRTQLQIAF